MEDEKKAADKAGVTDDMSSRLNSLNGLGFRVYMGYSLNFLKGVCMGDYMDYHGVIWAIV